MTAARAAPTPPDAAAAVLLALLEARTGQRIDGGRAWRLDTALGPLLRERGCPSLDALVGRLLAGEPGLDDRVVDALLNQETSFFRDGAVFDALAGALADAPRRARVWSAACATGQEPLSLAMLLAEARDVGGGEPADIVATDVSQGALARARAGRYTHFEVQRGLPIRRLMRWFEPDGDEWVVRRELRRDIGWRRHNLVDDPPPAGRFDAVLCRNVLLYLPPVRRAAVLDRIAAALRPGGVLLLGAGETVIGHADRFAPSPRWRGLYERLGAP